MHLADRGRGDRGFIDLGDHGAFFVGPISIKHAFQAREVPRLGVALQAYQLLGDLGRQHVFVLRGDLAELHGRAFHAAQRVVPVLAGLLPALGAVIARHGAQCTA